MADRVGVISKGELILVEDKADADEQARPQGADPATRPSRSPRVPRRACRTGSSSSRDDGHAAALCVRRQGRAHRHALAAGADARPRHRLQATSTPARARSRISSSAWSAIGKRHDRRRLQRARRLGDLSLRDAPLPPHPVDRAGGAGDHHLALFHRVRLGDRLADDRGRRGRLRQLHRARADDAVAVHRKHLQRARSASTCRGSPARSTNCCPRRCRPFETVLGYVGAAATKAIIVALVILATANLFVDVRVAHPLLMLGYLLLVAATFCLFGFIVGIWAKGFEQLQIIPLLVVTPLTFLGGAFYSIDMLPEPWRTITLFNPVVYLISGFRWTFFGTADVAVGISLAMTGGVPGRLPGDRLADLPHRLSPEDLSATALEHAATSALLRPQCATRSRSRSSRPPGRWHDVERHSRGRACKLCRRPRRLRHPRRSGAPR